jgi:hypothetical protein
VVPGATHHSILTAEYAPAVVKGIDFALKAAKATGPETRVATVYEGQSVTASADNGRIRN